MNYAERDKKTIIGLMEQKGGECAVDYLLNCESVEKLRVYPLIYRMREEGVLVITAMGPLGEPERVRLVQCNE